MSPTVSFKSLHLLICFVKEVLDLLASVIQIFLFKNYNYFYIAILSGDCYPGFTPIYRGFKCYYMSTATLYWQNSENDCKSLTENLGGLLEIRDNDTLNTILPFLGPPTEGGGISFSILILIFYLLLFGKFVASILLQK